ncbi:hypothetical protein [Thalassobacillus sp. CUG 92003]|uniref:hypothetical protein n=1 Tax=Thalassobacillus sp. CUG 92003 TaxID=2736641 RepID=UPI0015E799A9|nr:hypothetical protein [Thalassobacillus sp. CUG 92003]
MYKKICHRCQRPSFSSAGEGEWICPVCAEDLTSQPKLPANQVRPKPKLDVVYGKSRTKRNAN